MSVFVIRGVGVKGSPTLSCYDKIQSNVFHSFCHSRAVRIVSVFKEVQNKTNQQRRKLVVCQFARTEARNYC